MNQGENSARQICEGLPTTTTTTTTRTTTATTMTTTTTTTTAATTMTTTMTTESAVTTTLENDTQVPMILASTDISTRRPRFGTGPRTITYLVVDGKVIPSALSRRKKWPPRRVSFPSNDTHLVTGYLEPANPWQYAENVNREDLISTYLTSCKRHCTEPLESVINQLEKLDLNDERCSILSLKGEKLERSHCEPLEEILKRVQFSRIDLEGASLDDESAVALFDMIEYYESAVQLNISSNWMVGTRGWQACSHMIKKTNCLEQLEAKRVTLNEQHMPILSRALRIASHLQILKLENCGLSGRPTIILVAALKLNTGLKELYLADNDLGPSDAVQLGALLQSNNHLQLLDISNNNVQDSGVVHISDGLIEQRIEEKDGKGLNILVLWNNHLTRNSSQHFSRVIARSKTLEMLNIGQNVLANETLHIIKGSLQQNRTLLRLGLQSTHLTCEGATALAEIIQENRVLRRIDVRDNHIQNPGLKALAAAMKKNRSVTQLDLDDLPRRKLEGAMEMYRLLVTEIREYCTRNEEPCSSDETTEESGSPEHRSRLSSASSRKISLTCQTLPRSPPPIPSDGATRTLLEPKRTSGGRLRSPAPSPIPSPVASPIPSPSRGRFVVSRVSESSTTSSANSSTSSSPITPPSLGSSPTCIFPPATGASRFRVTVVEPAKPSPKSVITSTNTNVTVGFRYKIEPSDLGNSDDNDDVFKPGVGTNDDTKNNNNDKHEPQSTSDNNLRAEVTVKVQKTGDTLRCLVKDIIDDVEPKPSVVVHDTNAKSAPILVDQVSTPLVTGEQDSLSSIVDDEDSRSTKSLSDSIIIDDEAILCPDEGVCENVTEAEERNGDACRRVTTRSRNRRRTRSELPKSRSNLTTEQFNLSDNCVAAKSETPTSLQKQPTSLEKLLSLFQHPASLFCGSTSTDKCEAKNPLQSGVSSVMALGDKFHQYLMEGRCSRDSSPQPPLQRSSSDAPRPTSKSVDPVKSSHSVPQLCDIVGRSRASEAAESTNGDSTISEEQDTSRAASTAMHETDGETLRCRISERSLPDEYVQSKVISKLTSSEEETSTMDVVEIKKIDSNEIVNSVPVQILDNKTTLCVPKLKDIPEYSVLDVSCPDTKSEPIDKEGDNEVKCDNGVQTDSINLTSDRYSLDSCNVLCDKLNVVNLVPSNGAFDNDQSSKVKKHLNNNNHHNNRNNNNNNNNNNHISEISHEQEVDRSTSTEQHGNTTAGQDSEETQLNDDLEETASPDLGQRDQSDPAREIERVEVQEESNTTIEKIIDEQVVVDDSCSDFETATGIEQKVNCSLNLEVIYNFEWNHEEPAVGEARKETEESISDAHRRGSSDAMLVHEESTSSHEESVFSLEEVKTDSEAANGSCASNVDGKEMSGEPKCELLDDLLNVAYEGVDCCLERADSYHENASVDDKVVCCSREATKRGLREFDSGLEVNYFDGDLEELIFNMTDISSDTVIDESSTFLESTMGRCLDTVSACKVSLAESSSTTVANLHTAQPRSSAISVFVEHSRSAHRNSHDSGIEETNLSVSDDSIPEKSDATSSKREMERRKTSEGEEDMEEGMKRDGVWNTEENLAKEFEEKVSLKFCNNLDRNADVLFLPRSERIDLDDAVTANKESLENSTFDVTSETERNIEISGYPASVRTTRKGSRIAEKTTEEEDEEEESSDEEVPVDDLPEFDEFQQTKQEVEPQYRRFINWRV